MIPFGGTKPTPEQRAAMKARTAGKPNPRHIVTPAMRGKWPMLVRVMYRARIDGEAGVGDTVARVLGYLGGNAVKQFLGWAGLPCSCVSRQDWLNRRFPY